MKKLFTLLAFTVSFIMNSQVSTYSTSNGGLRSSAIGAWSNAAADYSFASGRTTTASGYGSTVFGRNSTSSGDYSTAMGYNTHASGVYSTAMGYQSTASGNYSKAIGYESTASGTRSFAGGLQTVASGGGSFAFHSGTTASGTNSTALGRVTVASDYASVVVGQYNSSGSSATSADSFSTSAPAFVIGNGTDSSNKSDAFKVMFNGDTTVSNDLTVSGDVVISSDARLKSNIVSLGSTLSKLLQIDGKSYEMKGKQKIGVLAQEIQEVFPELVSEDDNEMLAVNYQGLVPVLINALKEQDKIIKSQEERLANIENLIANLND